MSSPTFSSSPPAVASRLGPTWTVPVGDLRWAAGAMLAAAAALPRLPGHPGLPCPLRTLTGVPCPLCGMSTSVEAGVGGHPGLSVAANPAGIPLIVAAVLLLVLRPSSRLRVPVTAIVVVLAASWVFQLFRFGMI